MKIKTSKLTGAALDWAVATALGREPTYDMQSHGRRWHGWWLRAGGEYEELPWYSTNWPQGGPIIERERITVGPYGDDWQAQHSAIIDTYWGPTPLIAAMRCYVASKVGDEIDVPEELK